MASGLSISHRFTSAVLKAPPKQQTSKVMIERQDIACALHLWDYRTSFAKRPLNERVAIFVVNALLEVRDARNE